MKDFKIKKRRFQVKMIWGAPPFQETHTFIIEWHVCICVCVYIHRYRFLEKKQVHSNILHQFMVPPHMLYFCIYTWNMIGIWLDYECVHNAKISGASPDPQFERCHVSNRTWNRPSFLLFCRSYLSHPPPKRSIPTDQMKKISQGARNLKDFLGKRIQIHHEFLSPSKSALVVPRVCLFLVLPFPCKISSSWNSICCAFHSKTPSAVDFTCYTLASAQMAHSQTTQSGANVGQCPCDVRRACYSHDTVPEDSSTVCRPQTNFVI